MKNYSINIFHIIFITMTFIGLKNHVTIIPPLLNTVGRDGWASVLIATIIILPWLFLLLYIQKISGQKDIKDWLKQQIGKIGANTFSVILAIILILLAATTMRETLKWITSTFLQETPVIFLLFIYTALCFALALTNFQTIVAANVIVLFGVVIFGFFVAITNIQVKDYHLLQPFFEHGLQPVLKGIIYPLSGTVELILILFIQHQLKGKVRFIHYFSIVIILMLLTLGPLIGAITEFGPSEASKQRFPAYEEWGLVTLGRYIEHVDFLSIYQWLTGAFIRVGIFLYILIQLLNLQQKKKLVWGLVTPLFIIINLILLLAINDQTFTFIKEQYILPTTFFIFFSISLFLAIIAFFAAKKST